MEWTWRQQIYMLLQSSGIGFLLGILYDLLVTAGRVQRYTRPVVFVRDSLFGVLSALVTFYFSLSITDGQIHPLLFMGILVGFGAQHLSISSILCRVLYRFGVLLDTFSARVRRGFLHSFDGVKAIINRVFDGCSMMRLLNCEKKAKKIENFLKNS